MVEAAAEIFDLEQRSIRFLQNIGTCLCHIPENSNLYIHSCGPQMGLLLCITTVVCHLWCCCILHVGGQSSGLRLWYGHQRLSD
jgi:hypothetical protein